MTDKFNFALALLVITAIGLIDIFVIKESRPDPQSMVWIDAGSHPATSAEGPLNEGLSGSVELYGFWIDEDEVSHGNYQQFIADTGHVIFAEKTTAAGGLSLATDSLRRDWLKIRPGAICRRQMPMPRPGKRSM